MDLFFIYFKIEFNIFKNCVATLSSIVCVGTYFTDKGKPTDLSWAIYILLFSIKV